MVFAETETSDRKNEFSKKNDVRVCDDVRDLTKVVYELLERRVLPIA